MWIVKTIAILCFAVIFYHYIGYPILIALWARLTATRNANSSPVSGSRDDRDADGDLPNVTLIVAAYNEQDIIAEKLRNCETLDYPADRLNFIFVTDGSSDQTPKVVQDYIDRNSARSIQLLHEDTRAGKSHAINRATRFADGSIVVFSDANAIYQEDVIRLLVNRFEDAAVGAVSGQKTVTRQGVGESESVYWKYESAIKVNESNIASTTGVVGEMFAIRASLYRDIPSHIINDDAYLGMVVVRNGRRVVYEPRAVCVENPSASMADELTRRRRINAGRFQLLFDPSLWPRGDWRYALCFWSHKFLRLVLGPVMILLLISTAAVVLSGSAGWFFWLLFAGQLAVYSLAVANYFVSSGSIVAKLTKICSFIVSTNLNTIPSLINYLKGKQTVLWDRARRLS